MTTRKERKLLFPQLVWE